MNDMTDIRAGIAILLFMMGMMAPHGCRMDAKLNEIKQALEAQNARASVAGSGQAAGESQPERAP